MSETITSYLGELSDVKVFFFFGERHMSNLSLDEQSSALLIAHKLNLLINFSRDQNFGLNELAAVQDVRNDFTQQELDESTAIKDRGNPTLREKCRESLAHSARQHSCPRVRRV